MRDVPAEFERAAQDTKIDTDNFASKPFLHRSDVERGQLTLWDDECEGMCGV